MSILHGCAENVKVQSEKYFTPEQKKQFLHGCIDAGWHLFPERPFSFIDGIATCSCGNQGGCPGPGKHPWGTWSKPFDPRHHNTRNIINRYMDRNPDIGWLVHLGYSGLLVVDVDRRDNGILEWAQLAAELGLAGCRQFARSGSGGFHYLFRAPANVDPIRGWVGPNGQSLCRITPRPGVDILCGQTNIVLPFSPHKSGGFYQLTEWPPPFYDATPIAAQWNFNPKFHAPIQPTPAPNVYRAYPLHGGSSPADRARQYLDKAPASTCGNGECHNRLFWAACILVKDFDLAQAEALPILKDWAARSTHGWIDLDLMHKINQAAASPGPRGKLLNADRPHKPAPWEAEIAGIKAWITMGGTAYLVDGDGKVHDRQPIPVREGPPENHNALMQSIIDAATMPRAAELDREPHDESHCPHALSILMLDPLAGKQYTIHPPCKKNWCAWCWARKKIHVKDTIFRHLDSQAVDPSTDEPRSVFWYKVDRLDWMVTKRWLGRRKSQYFTLATEAIGSDEGDQITVFSELLPPGVYAMKIPCDQAADAACALVDMMPGGIRCRVYTSSRGWKLLADEKKTEPRLKFMGELKSTPDQQLAVLQGHGIHSETATAGGPYWPYRVRQWAAHGVEMAHLQMELEEGCLLPTEFRWGTKHDSAKPLDEWAVNVPTGEPPRPPFFLDL